MAHVEIISFFPWAFWGDPSEISQQKSYRKGWIGKLVFFLYGMGYDYPALWFFSIGDRNPIGNGGYPDISIFGWGSDWAFLVCICECNPSFFSSRKIKKFQTVKKGILPTPYLAVE